MGTLGVVNCPWYDCTMTISKPIWKTESPALLKHDLISTDFHTVSNLEIIASSSSQSGLFRLGKGQGLGAGTIVLLLYKQWFIHTSIVLPPTKPHSSSQITKPPRKHLLFPSAKCRFFLRYSLKAGCITWGRCILSQFPKDNNDVWFIVCRER